MALKPCVSKSYRHLVESGALPMARLNNYFNLEEITTARKISAAVINISGRQRMLCQRTAFFCMRLVCSSNAAERAKLRGNLVEAIELMEKSHRDLINAGSSIGLGSRPSLTIEAMYFEAPLYLDKQVRGYIDRVKAFVQVADAELRLGNPDLQYIVEAAGGELLEAFDAVVSQYQQESEIEQTQAQLLHREKMSSLGALMASIVHEINNPVSFIYGNLSHAEIYIQDLPHLRRLYQEYCPNPCPEIQAQIEEIDLDFLVEDLPKVMSSMQMGSNRIREIVKSMGSFSRTDNSNMTRCDLHESIDSTVLILRNRLTSQINRRDIQVVKTYGKLPAVECYAGQINQVFMNLLTNAIDALDEAAQNQPDAVLKISIGTELAGPDRVRVRIADTGAGMTPQIKEQMFEQFFTTKEIGKGTGLGLSIVYKILVENHRGTLRCESEPSKGTEFIIELPVQQT